MKELNIEEKAKRYDKAIAHAKIMLKIIGNATLGNLVLKNEFEIMFPELNEDERIRREMIKLLREEARDFPSSVIAEKSNSWIAWLEKQGEQNPVDKVEPKFKVGDWIVSPNGVYWYIDAINNNRYGVSSTDGACADWPLDTDLYHLWAIQDAKDGDVLEFGDHGRLVVGIVSYVNKTTGRVDVNCLLENNNFKVGNYYNLDTIKPHPAAKEQRDTLMKAMADAGYEWDAEKKELRKIEQKHTWSEEDVKRISSILLSIKYCKEQYPNLREYQYDIDWLKSLKYRVQPQLKQEWSEEDKRTYKSITYSFANNYPLTVQQQEFVKSLKERYVWKPSDEQMDALNDVISSRDIKYDVLSELWKDLKKLKG